MNRILPNRSWLAIASIAAALGALSSAGASAQEIGRFIFVVGDVRITGANGQTRLANRNDALQEGDSVSTSAGSSAQMRMIDGGFIAVRTDTSMKFDKYQYKGREDGSENAVMSLLKGGFRTITGIIGRRNKDNYAVNTAVATIGIRGTDHEPFFIPPPSPGEIPIGTPGAYNKVNIGSTVMRTDVGTQVIGSNQVGYAPNRNTTPGILPQVPNFMRPTGAPVADAKPKPGADKAAAEKPGAEKPGAEKPAAEKPGAEKPAAEKPAATAEKPAADKPAATADKPAAVAEKPAAPTPAPVAEKPAAPATPPTAAAPAPAPAATPSTPPAPEPIRTVAVVDNTASLAAGSAAATNVGAGLGGGSPAAPVPGATAGGSGTSAPGTSRPIEATAAGVTGQTTFDFSDQTLTAGQFVYSAETGQTTDTQTGQTFNQPSVVSGGQVAVGDFGILANNQATAAQNSYAAAQASVGNAGSGATKAVADALAEKTTTLGVSTVSTAPASSAISSATTAIGNAGSGATQAVNSAAALSLATTQSTATSNATAAGNLKSSADSTVSNAVAANTANGSFADSTAGPAKTSMLAAQTSLDTANSSVQSMKTSIDTKVATLASSQSAGQTAISNANAALGAANADLTAANTENAKIGTAQTAASADHTTAVNKLAEAQTAMGSGATTLDPTPSQASSPVASACGSAKACSDLATQYAAEAVTQQTAKDFTKAQNAFNNASTAASRAATFQSQAAAAETAGKAAATDAASQKTIAQDAATAAQNRVNSSAALAGTGATGAEGYATQASAQAANAQSAVTNATSMLSTSNTQFAAVQAASNDVATNAVVAQYNNPAKATTYLTGSYVTGIQNSGASNNQRLGGYADVKANTNFVLDGQKNLVEIRQTAFQVTNFQATPSINLSSADIKFQGGTAADTGQSLDATNGNVYYGRWQGGNILVDNGSNGTIALGARSAHWVVGYLPDFNYVKSLTGSATYTKIANTTPTDASGNTGTLNSATLSANFDTQKVDAGVNLTIASKTFGMNAANMPMSNNIFAASGLTPSCSGAGCTGAYNGTFDGSFFRANATAAGLGYTINPSVSANNPYPDLITGLVLFTTSPAPTLAPGAVVGDFGILAQNEATRAANSYSAIGTALTAANQAITDATNANTSTQAISTVSTAPATSAISSATSAIGNAGAGATQAVNSAAALSLATTQATASSNATTAGGLKTTADTTVASATAANTANGSFADSTAAGAMTAMQAAQTSLNTANSSVQSAKSSIDTQVTALASAQSAAQTALTSANNALTNANADLTAANSANTAITAAKTAAAGDVTTANAQPAVIQTAQGSGATTPDPSPATANSSFASSCATAKACSDLAAQYATEAVTRQGAADYSNAQNAFLNAKTAADRAATFETNAIAAKNAGQTAASDAASQLAAAQGAATTATSKVNSAATLAGTGASGAEGYATAASTQAGNAQSAVSATAAPLAASNSDLANAQAAATSVASQAAIAQYNNPAVATANGFQHTLAGVTGTGVTHQKVDGGGSSKPNTNYVLDGQKNLVEIRDSNYQNANFGAAGAPSYANADVKFSGGTAADAYQAGDGSLYLGRWQGGSILIDDLGNGAGVDTTVTLGAQSAHWLIARQPAAGYAQTKLTGTSTYTKLANTSPTDAAGNVGTLNSATFTADFTNHTVNAGVNLSVASKTYDMAINNMPITGNEFGGTGTANCSPGCSGTFSGDMQGAFAKTDASGAGLKYGIWPTVASGPYSDLIRGVVAFYTATPPAIAPQPATVNTLAYIYSQSGNNMTQTSAYSSPSANYTVDGSNNLLSAGNDPNDGGGSDTISGGTAQAQAQTTSASGSTVTLGRWASPPAISVNNVEDGSSSNRTVVGNVHWAQGPAIGPFYLPAVITGSRTYTATAGTPPTDQSGTTGTLNLGTTTLGVNFSNQSASVNIDATVGANNWIGNATGMRLDDMGQFYAGTGATDPHSQMTVTLNGSSAGTFGGLSGSLMGTGIDAAGVSYAFGQGSTNTVTGSAAFTNATQAATNTKYAIGLIAQGRLTSPVNAALSPLYGTSFAALDPEYVNSVEVGMNAQTRLTVDGANQVTKFDMKVPLPAPLACTAGCTGVATTPATFSVRNNDYPLDSPPSPGGTTPATALTNTGIDATTGIRWGRYVGFVSYVDRIGAANGAASGAFDARTSHWHAIWMDPTSAGATTSMPVLPTSGTFSYTAVGNTNPSDSNGNVGTLTSATLQANFTAMTVNAGVNASVGGNTWSASASNLPIVNGAYFQAAKSATASTLSVSVAGSATGTTAGKITGVFTGNATGSTGGAMMGYSLSAGGAAGTTMQGVVAFKK